MNCLMKPLAIVLVFGSVLMAKEAEIPAAGKLKIGDPAPALTCGKWIKGEPVKSFEQGTVYVVEFWATWCGPCRQSIPHLSKLQAQYKDKGVVIIGQNCSEEQQDKVTGFVEKMGAKMDYRVALDDVSTDKNGSMNTAWMEASGQNGIPTAFVVDKEGKIAWIGHPMELDKILEAVVAGKFNAKKFEQLAKEQAEAQQDVQARLEKIEIELTKGRTDEAMKMAEELAVSNPESANDVLLFKYRILVKKGDEKAAKEAGEKLASAIKDDEEKLNEVVDILVNDETNKIRDLSLAEKLALRLSELRNGEDDQTLEMLAMIYSREGKFDQAMEILGKVEAVAANEDFKMQVRIDKVQVLLKKKDYAAAGQLGDQIISAMKDNSAELAMFVAQLLEDKEVDKEALALAEKVINHAELVAKDADEKSMLVVYKVQVARKKNDTTMIKSTMDKLVAEAASGRSEMLLSVVDGLLGDEKPAKEDIELAENLANRANEQAKGEDANILAIVAKVHYSKAQIELYQAVELQSQAVEKAKDNDLRDDLQNTLDEYKAKSEGPSDDQTGDDTPEHDQKPEAMEGENPATQPAGNEEQ